jgi:hypothetical protein
MNYVITAGRNYEVNFKVYYVKQQYIIYTVMNNIDYQSSKLYY